MKQGFSYQRVTSNNILFNNVINDNLFFVGNHKILAPKGMNNLLAITGKKSMMVLGTVTGNGELLPPFILYGYVRYQKSRMEKLPDGNNLDIVLMYFYTVIFQFLIGIQYGLTKSDWMVRHPR